MLAKKLAMLTLNEALATGGDYAELYVEDTARETIKVETGRVESISNARTRGAGLRILKGLRSVYGYTADLSKRGLLSLARKLSFAYEGERLFEVKSFARRRTPSICPVKDPVIDVPSEERIRYLRDMDEEMRKDPRIVRARSEIFAEKKSIEIFAAEGEEGFLMKNGESHARITAVATASEDGKIETASHSPGTHGGWSFFLEKVNRIAVARKAREVAIALLSAKECPSGRFPVIIANGWGGVIFHEACGHSLEATATAKGLSVFSDSIGKVIASPLVTAYDDGTIKNAWGSNNADSEGTPTKKNLLIKDGVCTGFLVDKFNGRRLHMEPNGCSRRESYCYEPTSRMSNTYIAPGKDKPEDIIRDTELGLYVANFGGGSVDTTTGEFNFAASEAYIVRHGKIAEMVKGCILIGSGKEVLMNIDRVGNDLDLGCGYCGSVSGSVPVTVGQPTIRVKEITVGGRGGTLE